MKKNMGLTDRSIRLLAAVLLGFVYFMDWLSGGWQSALAIVISVLALTAVVGICPLYTLFGLHTDRGRKQRSIEGKTKTIRQKKQEPTK